MKLGPNRARQVRSARSLAGQQPKYAFSFRYFHRLQEAGKRPCGKDHTVLPYARPAISPQFFQPCRRSRKLTGETNLAAPLIRHEVLGSRRAIRPAHASRARRCRVHRKPGSRHMTTTRSPLKDEPGWATNTINPNFGKVEYFRERGLTAFAVSCPSGNGLFWMPLRNTTTRSSPVNSQCALP